MRKCKYNIGDKVGMLTILDKKRENNRTYLYCKCDCGNEKWIRSDSIGRVKGCGCLSKETQFKAKDITGMRFGRLTVLEKTEERDINNGSVIWKCKCDCGNITYVAEGKLVEGSIRSCGCLGTESYRKNIKKAIDKHLKEHIVFNTNIPVISRKTPRSNNTSGVTGVKWDKSRNKWIAEIKFRNKRYFLGRYEKKEDAIEARQLAKDNIHNKFLNWYNDYKKNNNNNNK